MCSKIIENIATALSYIFHPILAIIYFLITVFFCSSFIDGTFVTLKFKMLLLGQIAFLTILLPILLHYIVKYGEKCLNLNLFRKGNRLALLLITAICYIIAMFSTTPYFGVFFAKKLFLTAAIVISAANVLMLFMPVSLHILSLSVATALMIGMQISRYADFETAILVSILITGFVGSSRLVLEQNKPSQLAYSYGLGLFLTLFLLWL
ncbi:MAG: hypothetical protein R3Y50_11215 [Rikenellaceae bacterium]